MMSNMSSVEINVAGMCSTVYFEEYPVTSRAGKTLFIDTCASEVVIAPVLPVEGVPCVRKRNRLLFTAWFSEDPVVVEYCLFSHIHLVSLSLIKDKAGKTRLIVNLKNLCFPYQA